MTVADCIIRAADGGMIDKGAAQETAARYDELVDELSRDGRLSFPEAQRRAASRLQGEIERAARRWRRMRLKQASVEAGIAARAGASGDRVDAAMMSVLEFDPSGRIAGPSVAQRVQIVRGEAHAAMVRFLDTFRSRHAGLTRKLGGIDNVVRELFAEESGDQAAKAMAKGLSNAIDHLRGRFNAAGGDVLVRENWGFFQRHDRAAVAAVTRDEWKAKIWDRLAPERMYDASGQPITLRSLTQALDETYDSIVTGGLSDITRAGDPKFGSPVNARAAARFLAFKTADDWLSYHREFGGGNVYDHIIGSVEALARDVGTIEVLGPFPKATLEYMKGQIDEAAARGALSMTGAAAARLADKIGGPKTQLEALFDTVTGRAAIAENGIVANVSQGNRNIVVSAVLGGAWLSSLADTALTALTARFNGLSATRVLGKHLKLFLPTSGADRRTAVRLGFTAQGWANRAIGAQRIMGEVTGSEFTSKITDTVLRLSLLSPWTENGRWAFQTEMLGFITENAGKSWASLPRALRESFERHGLTPADWSLIRSTPKWADPETGATFIRAEDVARHSDPARLGEAGVRFEAANKLQQAIFVESQFAIIETTQRVRSILTAGRPAGTFWGEVMRNSALFKGFPVTVLNLHLRRMMQTRGVARKGEYLAWLFIGTSVMGALGEQLSQVSKGRDPLNMDPSKEGGTAFWAQSFLRGGGAGLFGDFLFSDVNRFGGGIASSLLGPVLGSELSKGWELTVGNVQELFKGKDTHAGREIARFAEMMMPGRSLWYARVGLERLLFDELEAAVDPKAHQSFRAIESRARRDYHQRFWWRPGQALPERGPDTGAALP